MRRARTAAVTTVVKNSTTSPATGMITQRDT